jgi:hypothetical protein
MQVSDFGLSRVHSEHRTVATETYGTVFTPSPSVHLLNLSMNTARELMCYSKTIKRHESAAASFPNIFLDLRGTAMSLIR